MRKREKERIDQYYPNRVLGSKRGQLMITTWMAHLALNTHPIVAIHIRLLQYTSDCRNTHPIVAIHIRLLQYIEYRLQSNQTRYPMIWNSILRDNAQQEICAHYNMGKLHQNKSHTLTVRTHLGVCSFDCMVGCRACLKIHEYISSQNT